MFWVGWVIAAAGLGMAFGLVAFLVVSVTLLLGLRPVARAHLRQPAALRTGTAALVGRRATVVDRIAAELGIPVKLIGIGEQLEDLRPFDPDEFARALLSA